jgi:urea carboxylase-associated protein 1
MFLAAPRRQRERSMSEPASTETVIDAVVAPGRPWGHVVRQGEILRLVDLQGQQAVDFLCFDAADPRDRYNATNTIKVQGNIYVGAGTVLYSDRGAVLFTIVADTCGRHDTVYGCCSEANNFLRYGVRGTPSCYANFCEILAQFGLDEQSIVANVNFFMSVPVLPDGSAGVADGVSRPGSLVELRAERDVLAVLSNCPQMYNPCNGYNPTPIRATIYHPAALDGA